MIRGLLTIVCLLIIAGGTAGLYFVEHEMAMARASRSWPTVAGTITASEVDEIPVPRKQESQPQILYIVRIRYDYTVKGKAYAGNRIRLLAPSGVYLLDEDEAHRLADRYPHGDRVTVYYKPGKPELAVLEPGALPSRLLQRGRRVSITVLAIGVVLLLTVLLGGRLVRNR